MTKKTKEQLAKEVESLTAQLEALHIEAAEVANLKATNAQTTKDLKVVRGQLTKLTKAHEAIKTEQEQIKALNETLVELNATSYPISQEITEGEGVAQESEQESEEPNMVVEFWSNVIRPSVARTFLQCLKTWLDTVQQIKGKTTYYTLLTLVLTVSAFTSGLAVFGFVTLLNIETVLTFKAISIALYSIVFAVHVYVIGYLTEFWSSINNRLKR